MQKRIPCCGNYMRKYGMQIFAKLKRRVSQGPGEHSVYSTLKTEGIVSSSKESSNCYIFFSDKFANEKLPIL